SLAFFQARRAAETPRASASASNYWVQISLSVALFLTVIMAIRKLSPVFGDFLNRQANSLAAAEAAFAERWPKLMIEDPTLAEFFYSLRASLNGSLNYCFAEAPGR